MIALCLRHPSGYDPACPACQVAYYTNQREADGAPSSAAEAALLATPSPNQRAAEEIADVFSKKADELIAAGKHPGDISFGMTIALTLVFKMFGGADLATVKALVCDSIDEIWRIDDEAQKDKLH